MTSKEIMEGIRIDPAIYSFIQDKLGHGHYFERISIFEEVFKLLIDSVAKWKSGREVCK